MLLFGANRVLIFTMVRDSATGCVNYFDKSPDGMGRSFLAFSLADPRRAATSEVAIADEERGCRCSSLCSVHVDEDCFALKQGHC